ncbi:MAG: hypothetical protein WC803_12855 [Sphingomonas sp.]|jgi:hypothetical protein
MKYQRLKESAFSEKHRDEERKEHNTREIMQCSKFIIDQIKKGWTAQEACIQGLTQYGYAIYLCSIQALNKSLKK